ncbi:MAG TPA: methyltransferase [Ferrovibrio sp.]|uniref:methyltransferase n=1 Tax=Ferrovibrio sp. TaxID=1917215 RepID=UPI002ED47493
MNRRERRRQKKSGAAAAAPGRPGRAARPASVSEMLLGLGGVRPLDPPAAPAKPAVDPVQSALAQLRLNQGLAVELGKQEQALRSKPDSEALLLSVARLQARLERRADALLTYRRLLALRPDHAEAAHMVGVLSGTAPDKPDTAYIADLFDQFADSFDEKLSNWLEYQGPQHVAAATRVALGEGQAVRRAIDLGCGTGLLGPEIRQLTERLDGIDLSPRMIAKARLRHCYDDLAVGDIVDILQDRRQSYDLALAADVLSYFGDLKQVFAAVCASLHEGGVFVATVEKGIDGRYDATRTGRYQHGEAYLRRCAADAGFVLLSLEEVILRREENKPVPGFVFALRQLAAEAAARPAAPAADLSVGDIFARLETPAAALAAIAVQQVVSSEHPVGWAIDLGGGLARHAATLRSRTQHLDMVSPDPARSRMAFELGLYDECDTAEVIPFLETRPDHYDLIVAADPQFAQADPARLCSAVKIALALAGAFIAFFPAAGFGDDVLRDIARAEGLVVLAVEPVTFSDGSAGLCLVAES